MTEATKKTTKARKPAAKKATTTRKPASLELPRNPMMFEVLDLVSRQRTKAKKIEALQKHGDISLKAVLIWNFDETVKSALPDGPVPYGDQSELVAYTGTLSDRLSDENRRMFAENNFSLGNREAGSKTTLRAQWKNLYNFVVGGNGGLTNNRRETMFINLLEGLHPLEAEILCLVKDKKLGDSYKITREVVETAFPDIQWGGRG